jgi:hypothetical protein
MSAGRVVRIAGLLAFVVLLLATAVPAGAMTHGWAVKPAPPWAALLITNERLGLKEEPNCSGTIIADGWVLTAGHCVAKDNGTAVKVSSVRVLIGRSDRDAKKEGAAYGVERIVPAPGYKIDHGVWNDVALVKLADFETDRWHAVPIAFESGVGHAAGGVTAFGYGHTGWNAVGADVGAGKLWTSPDRAFVRDPKCDGGGAVCFRGTGKPRILGGDSGGPWMRWAAEAWQLIAVTSTVGSRSKNEDGNPVMGKSLLGLIRKDVTTREWVRSVVNANRRVPLIPSVPDNTIVRSAAGDSWLVNRGYRRWIPTGGDYLCWQAQGVTVRDYPQITIDTIPDRVGLHATCTPQDGSGGVDDGDGQGDGDAGGGGGGTTVNTPTVTLAQGPTAPAGYRYAVTLAGFAPNTAVSITCFDSVSPGGFYTFSLTTDPAGSAYTASYCFSGDGPDHWVVAGGVPSNHVTWGSAPPPVVGPKTVTLAQGPAAPAGYRYSITLANFPANSGVTITCFDSVSPSGFYTFTLTTNAAGGASTAAYCYSGDGPDHWVVADGVGSNHVTWGGAPPPPPQRRVILARGPAAPAGFRYAITLQAFAPDSVVSVSCRDSVDPGGFYTFNMTTDGAGNAFVQNQCYSGDHPDHWVVAGGIESNHVTW